MIYGIGRVDASGRVADHEIVKAFGWQPGEQVEVVTDLHVIVIRASPGGMVCVPRRPCVVLPAPVRRHRGIAPGDRVLLAAAPDHGVLIVHTLADLDVMLSEYHASRTAAR